MLPEILLVAGTLAVIAALCAPPLLLRRRRRLLQAQAFPAAWRAILRGRMPLYLCLPAALKLRLEKHVQVFVAEKEFFGCDGLEITEEMRVTIAAQACLLLLDQPGGYFPRLREILVYPGAFVVERLRPEPSGVLQEHRQVLAGESWTRGQVILSWEDTLQGAAIPDDGRNVVIHEFAHQVDQEKGHANGAPVFTRRERYQRWSAVLGEEFARLRESTEAQVPTLLNPYGASDPAEFFAVATEVFFEQGARLAAEHPALYGELRSFYRVDPANW